MRQTGVTLVGLIMGVAVMGIVVVGGASLMQIQSGSMRYMTQKSETFSLKSRLVTIMSNPDNCSCQLNPSLTTDDSNDPALTFDSTPAAPLPRTINLRRIREGCAATSEILVEENGRAVDGLVVERVEFTDLLPTGNPNQWRGKWRVSFRPVQEGVSIAPVELHQFIYADPGSIIATPGAALIGGCRAPVPPGLVNSCPAGYTLVGGPSTFTSFCMQMQEQGPASFLGAKTACANDLHPGFGPPHMCTRNEWTYGCDNNLDPSFRNSVREWFPDNNNITAATIDNGACQPTGYVAHATPLAYRCCIK